MLDEQLLALASSRIYQRSHFIFGHGHAAFAIESAALSRSGRTLWACARLGARIASSLVQTRMLDSEVLNRMATAYEAVVEKRFKKLRYSVERLDRQKPKSRPDFLILASSGRPQMLCEVKTVFSGGYLQDKGVHVSMLDDKLENFGVFRNEIDLTLVHDEKRFKELPLLVAFLFDFFADFLHFYPRNFNADVSGILTIKSNTVRTQAFEKLSIEEQEQRLRRGSMAGLPPDSKDFVLVRNKNKTRRSIPRAFQHECITEGYGESI